MSPDSILVLKASYSRGMCVGKDLARVTGLSSEVTMTALTELLAKCFVICSERYLPTIDCYYSPRPSRAEAAHEAMDP